MCMLGQRHVFLVLSFELTECVCFLNNVRKIVPEFVPPAVDFDILGIINWLEF